MLREALAQLPGEHGYRVGKKVLVRTDAGGGTHAFLEHLTKRRLSYSVGFSLTETMADQICQAPEHAWTPAYDADGQVRDGAWVGRGHRPTHPHRLAGRDAGDRA